LKTIWPEKVFRFFTTGPPNTGSQIRLLLIRSRQIKSR